MEIPLLKSWIYNAITNELVAALVDPGKIDINFESTGPTGICSDAQPKKYGIHILHIIFEYYVIILLIGKCALQILLIAVVYRHVC